MKIEAKKVLLTQTHKLDASDFYSTVENNGDNKLIIKRSGIDKLEKQNILKWRLENISTVPYSNKVCTTIVLSGNIGMNSATTVASANPDNCKFQNYAEVALKRSRHRLLLILLDLYQHNIFSDEESDTFELLKAAKDFSAAADEARKALLKK